MRRNRRQPPPDLTSLFDVLFIVIFAALIRAAAAQHAADAKPAPRPRRRRSIRPRCRRAPATQVAERPTVIVRRRADGKTTEPTVTSLLEPSADPDIALSYRGDICALVHAQQPTLDLAKSLVIIAPAARLADLPHALYERLASRCRSLPARPTRARRDRGAVSMPETDAKTSPESSTNAIAGVA